ncbi:MAG: hypothetical protein KDB22_12100 [Planctomycetales bacterium]|nr:hypothetical protein [Planctomycetales bacterium]
MTSTKTSFLILEQPWLTPMRLMMRKNFCLDAYVFVGSIKAGRDQLNLLTRIS